MDYAVIGRMYGESYYTTVAEGLSLKAAEEAMKDARRLLNLDEVRKIAMETLPEWKALGLLATNEGHC